MGWLPEKVLTVMAAYPQMTEEKVMDDLTGAQSWVYYVWAVEREARMRGVIARRRTPGYVKQQVQQILKSNG